MADSTYRRYLTMDRVIKFRVWSAHHKKYFTLQERANRGDIMPRDNELKITTNYELILEQFTGLLDKNGKEIYEGDIVKHDNFTSYKGAVLFKNGMFIVNGSVKFSLGDIDLIHIEIIGTIHDKEMLK